MNEREESSILQAKVQLDNAYLVGEHNGGKAGRESENKDPVIAAAFADAGHFIHARLYKPATSPPQQSQSRHRWPWHEDVG